MPESLILALTPSDNRLDKELRVVDYVIIKNN